ncbi:MAG: DUF6273 domain-containing protein [Oscillospiraceae bacterium]|nr:DUF6273 domain-containing protein [Oscillospiraceae bacterium]
MKKVISILLIIAMMLSFPVTASASDLTTADALTVLRAAAGLITLTAEQATKFGITGTPSTTDALRILRAAAGITVPADTGTANAPAAIGAVSVGSVIKFGGYDWRVLEVKDGRALILSDRLLEKRIFSQGSGRYHVWSVSEIRKWLNDEFYNSFNSTDRAKIQQTTITNADNQWFGASGGEDTADYIFLLSIDEVVKYFGDSGQLQNRPAEAWWIDDQFNSARRAFCISCSFNWCGNRSTNPNGFGCFWWLRSPGSDTYIAAGIYNDGTLNVSGDNVAEEGAIRPAMWIDL